MLVLSRKKNETIVLDELGVTIQVVKLQGNTVRIGVQAPQEIRIFRGEHLEHNDDRSTEQRGANVNATVGKAEV